ncbi:Crp/Fnr family transcriptional regulator [Altericroceibacterium xinjiangense]|uniref:Crp/Fnr family transcriptional regulator n=1 Tax=Altericroceibacterium xinjiangense TaxID=762261 RepID=UPI0013DF9795|nr:Crp/Fnr family transcriptional regulator [Altericroceibacterium xinjiangense]
MSPSQATTSNLLLRSLSSDDYALLEPHFVRTELAVGDIFFDRHRPIEQVHFIENGVGSIVSDGDGDQIETGIFGRDGMTGIPVILHAGETPQRSFLQIGKGIAWTLSSEQLLRAFDSSVTLRTVLLRYVQAMNVQAGSTAASNAHYALPERLARWLLMCHDRIDGDQMELTHQFMSIMLAVRRSGVTVTLHTLEGTGAIRASRGLIHIADRARLEEIAGESYGEPEREYRRLIGPFGKGAHGAAAVR